MKEVYKFGGTSVDHLEQIANIILLKKDTKLPYVCVSAFSGVTDKLLDIINDAKSGNNFMEGVKKLKLFHIDKLEFGVKDKKNLSVLNKLFESFFEKRISEIERHLVNIAEYGVEIKDFDPVIGFGEQISAFLLAELISVLGKSKDIRGRFVDLGKIVTGNFKTADKAFLEILRENISEELIEKNKEDEISIITGFIGKVPGGILNGIDRGYTDFTAALVSSVISSKKLIIFKEVDGICTADPRIVKNVILLKHLSYTEVLKMASSGMKAINTEAVKPAMADNIPIEVRNTFYPEKEGTLITSSRSLNPNVKIQTIPSKKGVTIVRFGGYNDGLLSGENLWSKFLQLLKKYKVKKYLSTSDEAGSSVVVKFENDKIEALVEDLKVYANVKVNYNCALVGIVGEEMKGCVGTFALAANAIANEGVNIHMVCQGASEISIIFVVNEEDVNKSIEALHKVFFKG